MPQVMTAIWAGVKAVASYVGAHVAQVAATAGTAAVDAPGNVAVAAATSSISLTQVLNAVNFVAGVAQLTMRPKIPRYSTTAEFKSDPMADIPFCLGRIGTGGNIIHANAYGDQNQWLTYVTIMSGAGPVNSIEGFYSNDKLFTFNPTTWNCSSDAYFTNRMYQGQKLGARPDTAFVVPSGEHITGYGADWTSAHKLSGMCSSWWWLKSAQARYPSGVPKPLWVIQGIKLWDPRFDSTYPGGSGTQRLATPSTWGYTKNPFIHGLAYAMGYMMNGKRIGGIGMDISRVDVASFLAAANIADANGWEVGGVITSGMQKWPTLAAILAAGGGAPCHKNGLLSCTVNTPMTSVATLQQEDLLAPPSIDTSLSWRDRVNGITPQYTSELHRWQQVAGAAVVSKAAYVTQDNGVVHNRDVPYELVTDADQVNQLAAYDLANSREFKVAVVAVKPKYMGIRVGEAITLNIPEGNINNEKFVVLRRRFDPQTWTTTLTCRSETDAKHAWALAYGGTPAYDPGFSPPEVPTAAPGAAVWDTNGTSITAADGSKIPAVVGTLGSGQAHPDGAEGLIVEYKKNADSVWMTFYEGPVVDRVEVRPLEPLTSYDVGYRYTFAYAVSTDPLVETVTTGDNIASEFVDQGDLATKDQVDTPDIVVDAVTLQDTQIRTTGYGGAGAITIIYNAALTTFTQLDSYTFNYGGTGDVTLEWIGLIQWAANAARSANFYLCLDQTPNYSGGADHNFQAVWNYSGNQNALTIPAILPFTFSGLSTGSHTVTIYGKATTSGANQPAIDVGATMKMFVGKK